jgi:hypothetical protein
MPDDIAFLRSHISSELEGRPSVNQKQFRNVSIITILNLPKDVINDLGTPRFAGETNPTPSRFPLYVLIKQ